MTAAACQPNPMFRQKMKEMTQTIAESYIEEGVAKSLAAGQVRAYRDTLRRQLILRFGHLPETLLQRIEAASDPARLQAALDQVIPMKSLDELTL